MDARKSTSLCTLWRSNNQKRRTRAVVRYLRRAHPEKRRAPHSYRAHTEFQERTGQRNAETRAHDSVVHTCCKDCTRSLLKRIVQCCSVTAMMPPSKLLCPLPFPPGYGDALFRANHLQLYSLRQTNAPVLQSCRLARKQQRA